MGDFPDRGLNNSLSRPRKGRQTRGRMLRLAEKARNNSLLKNVTTTTTLSQLPAIWRPRREAVRCSQAILTQSSSVIE